MTQDKILISKKAAAERLSVSLRTVDYLVSRGELKPRRVGKRAILLPKIWRSSHAGITPRRQSRDNDPGSRSVT